MSGRFRAPGVLAGLFCAAVAVLFVSTTEPAFHKGVLAETVGWSVLMLVSFAGWGHAAARLLFPARRPDVGLAMIWGVSVTLALGGVLGAVSMLHRSVLLLIVELGLVAACAAVVMARARIQPAARACLAAAQSHPLITIAAVFVAGLALLHLLGAAADTATNPYDDDVAYLAFVRKLVQTGTLIEPFSFRRLSALGGQTFLMALAAPHTTLKQLNVVDRGIGTMLLVGLLVGFRSQDRRPHPAVVLLVTAFFLYLPNTSINTAPHYLGVAFFVGLHRTLLFVGPDDRAWARAAAAGGVAAAVCTLRQNYLVVPVVLLAWIHGARLLGAWRGDRRSAIADAGAVAGATALALSGWLVLAYRSNGTFLFPLQLGTYRPSMALQSATTSPWKELSFFFRVMFEYEPLHVLPGLLLAGVLVRESHASKPLRALWVAAVVGAAALTHSFTLSDPSTLSRYLFGPLAALALLVPLSAASEWSADTGRRRNLAALALAAMSILAQVPSSRPAALKTMRARLRDIDVLRRRPPLARNVEPARFLYESVQGAVPPGARLLAAVDEPFHLDYARNDVLNVDMPGFASLKPGMPFFEGPEKLAAYLLSHDLRYVVFVRPDHSHWLYQREFWFTRMFNEEEIWRLCAPYFVDFGDNLMMLTRTRKVVREEAGIIVLDVAEWSSLEAP